MLEPGTQRSTPAVGIGRPAMLTTRSNILGECYTCETWPVLLGGLVGVLAAVLIVRLLQK